MGFREKSAWFHLLILGVLYGNYFLKVLGNDLDDGQALGLLLRLTITFIILEIAFRVAAAALAPKDASAPEDERDKRIRWRAGEASGYVLGAGAVFALFAVHFGADKLYISNAILASLVLAEIADCGGRIWLYRRG